MPVGCREVNGLGSFWLAGRQAQTREEQLAVLGSSVRDYRWGQAGHNCTEAVYDASRLVEPPRMRVACREVAICGRVLRILLDAKEKFWDRPVVAPLQEMSDPDPGDNPTDATTGTEAQRGLKTPDREIRLAGPASNCAAYVPAACETRVQDQRMVDCLSRGADISTEIG